MLTLQKELSDAKTKEAALDARYGPENPLVQEVKNQITELESQITVGTKALEDKFKSDYERALRDANRIKTERDKAKSEAVRENQSDIKLNTLEDDVKQKQKLYNDLINSDQQAELKLKEQSSNIKIIEPNIC